MFLGDAIIKCPDLVVLPYDYEGFQEVSGIVADQLQLYAEQYNGCVEQVSCDEAYVEITVDPNDCQQNDIHDFVKSLAEHIRADIVKKTECTASIGIGPNKVSVVFHSFSLHLYNYLILKITLFSYLQNLERIR
jgi:DNA repair protein REV1